MSDSKQAHTRLECDPLQGRSEAQAKRNEDMTIRLAWVAILLTAVGFWCVVLG